MFTKQCIQSILGFNTNFSTPFDFAQDKLRHSSSHSQASYVQDSMCSMSLCVLFNNLCCKAIGLFLSLFLGISSLNAQSFQEVSGRLGIDAYCVDQTIMGGGVAFFDYNQDYYPDVFILGGERNNALYRNNWDGTFSNVSKIAGIELADKTSYGVAIGDIDNDGDEDMLITTGPEEANVLLQNMGDGTFEDISAQAGITDISWSTSASMGDVNQDGWVDIYVNNYAEYTSYPFAGNIERCSPNFLYLNLGNNQFRNVAEEMGVADIGCGLAVSFTDCDNDQDIDLHIANDFGGTFEANELYVNAYPAQGFQQAPPTANVQVKINGMGIAIGDYDEDGDLDYYVTNMGDNPFFENKGNGAFEELAYPKGIANPDGTSWGTAFLDYNHDTYLDLVVANGKVVEATHQNNENRLFQGSGSHTFQDISREVGLDHTGQSRGFSMADYDLDGDLDMMFGVVAAIDDPTSNTLLYQNNQSEENNWLHIKLQGSISHRNGYGTHVRAVIGERTLMREADGGSSYLSHSGSDIHVGLGQAQSIDSLIITWSSGHEDVFYNLSPNQHILAIENSHWLPFSHQELSLTEGDSIFLAGAFQQEAGIYHHVAHEQNGTDSILLITKLRIESSPIISHGDSPFFLAPNPFDGTSRISYTLGEDSKVSLSLYDLTGRHLRTLVDAELAAGAHVLELGSVVESYPQGIYLFRLRINASSYVLKAVKGG